MTPQKETKREPRKRKLSIYQKASAKRPNIKDLYRWEDSRCRGSWDAGPHLLHLCGLNPKHKGQCTCRHCGKKRKVEP